jgi:hypothetical protein
MGQLASTVPTRHPIAVHLIAKLLAPAMERSKVLVEIIQ